MKEKHIYLVYPRYTRVSYLPCAAFSNKKDAKRYTNRHKHNAEYDIEEMPLDADFVETTTKSAYYIEIGNDQEVQIKYLAEVQPENVESKLERQYLNADDNLYVYVLAENQVEALTLAMEIANRLIRAGEFSFQIE